VAGPCVNGTSTVTINVAAAGATITSSTSSTQTFCDGRSTVVLAGTTPLYINETGLWTRLTGTGIISNTTSPTTTITGVGAGTSTFRWAITNSVTGCSNNGTHTININTNPTITVNGGVGLINLACNASTASIPFTTTGNATVTWRLMSGPTTTTYPTIPNTVSGTVTTPLSVPGLNKPGVYTIRFFATPGASTGGCAIVTSDITIVVSNSPTSSNGGSAQLLACNVTSTNLAANNPTSGTGKWSQISGPNTAIISNVNLNTSAVSGLIAGTYLFNWRISAGSTCGANNGIATVKVATTTPTIANAGSDNAVCNGTPYSLQGNTPALNETGTWTVSPSAGISFSNANSPSAVASGLAANTSYTFTWTIVNTCGSTSDTVVITTNSTVGPIQSNAGADQCLTGGTTSLTLSGNAPPTGSGLWTQLSGPTATFTDATLRNTSVTGLSNGNYVFQWAISSGGCLPSLDTVAITISNATTTAAANVDQTVCGSSVTLAANTPTIGSGTWTMIDGDFGAVITSNTNPATTITNLIESTYTFRWTITNGVCASTFDDVVIYASVPPSTALAGIDINRCGSTTATLAATAATSGTGLWSVVTGPNTPTITTQTAANSGITGLTSGTYIFRWTVSGGVYCPVSTDDVQIKVVPTANAGADKSYCGLSTVQLLPSSLYSGTWSQISGPNTATITTSGAYNAIASGLIAGAYTFRFSISDVSCTASFDDVVITISSAASTSVAGADQSICHTGSIALGGNTPSSGTGTWSVLSGPTGVTFSPNATTPSATANLTASEGIYAFLWTITNGSCTSADQTRVVDSALPSTANAGTDINPVCGNSVNLAAVAPTFGVGTWSQVSGPNTATFSSTILNNAAATGLITGVYTFRWTVSNGAACANSSFDDVVVTVNTVPTTPNAGIDVTYCNATNPALTGNTISTGTGTWTQVSGPTATFSNSASPTSNVSLAGAGVYTFQWTSSNGSCSLNDQVVVTNYAIPTTSNAGANQSVCQYTAVTLNGNTPTVGVGIWTLQSGPTSVSFVDATLPNTQVLGMTIGTYIFKWTISNGTCTDSSSTVQVVIGVTPDSPILSTVTQPTCFTPTGSFTITNYNAAYTYAISPSSGTTIVGNAITAPIGNFTLTATSGSCTSISSSSVEVVQQSFNPTIPVTSVTQPNCSQATGSISVTFQQTGETYSFDNGVSYQASNVKSGLAASVYNIKIKFTSGCVSVANATQINVQPLVATPGVTITQPTCAVNTGSVQLSGLPSTGWSITDVTNSISSSGTGATTTLSSLTAGISYNFTVTETVSGFNCISSPVNASILVNSSTWNGSSWSNGVPTADTATIMTGNYNSSGNLYMCRLTVSNGAVVNVAAGHNFIVTNEVNVETGSSLTFESNANLVQINNVSDSGNIIVKRNTNAQKRMDYVMWSTPVVGQNLKAFSPLTYVSSTVSRFYEYNSLTNQYKYIFTPEAFSFTTGKGYLIRMPNTYSDTVPAVFNGQFTGVPNNGNLSISVVQAGATDGGTHTEYPNSGPPITDVPNVSTGYNAIGNPYPSTIDADAFMSANNLDEAIYFWRKTNNTTTSSYATYTYLGGSRNTEYTLLAPELVADLNGLTPSGVIQVGQGFIFKAVAPNVIFNNSMRLFNNANQFLRTTNVEKHRIWLNLASETLMYNSALIGYMTGATQGVDPAIDGKYINDCGTALTSYLDNKEYVIQGRSLPFVDSDIVPLVFKNTAAGNYTISIDHVDGLFSDENQNIFLKDNFTNVTHDIKQSAYTFASEIGVFNNRFEIVYNNSPLSTQNPTFNENSVVVYKQNDVLNVNAGSENIKGIKIFDVRGRLLYEKSAIRATSLAITDLTAEQQVLIVQIALENGKKAVKKIVY
jgi:hypothetical protein